MTLFDSSILQRVIGYALVAVDNPINMHALHHGPLHPIFIFNDQAQAEDWRRHVMVGGNDQFRPSPVMFSGVYGAAYYGGHLFLMRRKVVLAYNEVAGIKLVQLRLDCCRPLPVGDTKNDGWSLMAIRHGNLDSQENKSFQRLYEETSQRLDQIFGQGHAVVITVPVAKPVNN